MKNNLRKSLVRLYINNEITIIELLNLLLNLGYGYNEFKSIYTLASYIKGRRAYALASYKVSLDIDFKNAISALAKIIK